MSASTHPVAPEEIMALLDGELSLEHGKNVSSHVESCSECSEIAASFVRGSQLLSSWTASAPFANTEVENRISDAAQISCAQPRSAIAIGLNTFLRRHWIFTAACSAAVIATALLVVLPNRMALVMQTREKSIGVDTARTNSRAESIDGRLATGQHREAGTLGKIEAYVTPGTVADSNGLFHGVGDHAQGSFSVDGRPITDQQSKLFGGPMIARTISLSITAKDFSASRASLDVILMRHHGYAAGLAVSTEQDAARSLQASLRIPAAELNAALVELKSLGRVQNETQNGEEVTQRHADLVARLKNSRETELRLQNILLNRTGKISDVLAVEQEIARVRGEIEQMEAEQKNLEHRVDFASVDLRLSEEYKAQLGSPWPSVSTRFHNAFVSGYRSAAESIISFVLFLIEYGPSSLLWLTILVPMVWLTWRRWRRSMAIASSVS
jgi:Domain of unknown function (DUF4349)